MSQATNRPVSLEESTESYNDQNVPMSDMERLKQVHEADPILIEPHRSQDVGLNKMVEQDFIRRAVTKINELHRRTVDDGKLDIGDYILQLVFKGRMEDAISKNPHKDNTFSRIAESPELEVDSRTLGSWVRAAAVRSSFIAQDLDFPHLTCSHYIELATLKDKQKRSELAAEAEEKKYSVRSLRKRVKEIKNEGGDGDGGDDKNEHKVQLDKLLKTSLEVPFDEGFRGFVSNQEAIEGEYSTAQAIKAVQQVNKLLRDVKTFEDVLKEAAGSLKLIVDKAMGA